MSRHRRSGSRRRARRRELLAEIERLKRLLADERAAADLLRREVAAPGSEDQTVYIPRIKLDHTPSVPLITPDGKRTTAHTGSPPAHEVSRPRPKWARDG